MIGAFVKAIEQLSDPRTRRYVWMSVGLALVIFVALWGVVGFLLTETALFSMAWLDTAIDVLGGLATLVVTWLLFPAVISGFLSLFLDGVADSVEARHFPGLPAARGQTVGEQVLTALRFTATMVALNLLLLVFLLLGPLFPLVFYGVNGYLLGREYFELVAQRRVDEASMRSLRKARGGRITLVGVGIALLLTVPVVNLLAPVIGTAAMVHLFEGWRSKLPAAGQAG